MKITEGGISAAATEIATELEAAFVEITEDSGVRVTIKMGMIDAIAAVIRKHTRKQRSGT